MQGHPGVHPRSFESKDQGGLAGKHSGRDLVRILRRIFLGEDFFGGFFFALHAVLLPKILPKIRSKFAPKSAHKNPHTKIRAKKSSPKNPRQKILTKNPHQKIRTKNSSPKNPHMTLGKDLQRAPWQLEMLLPSAANTSL